MDWTLKVHSLRQALTQPVPLRAYGCPLVDGCYLGRPFSGARVPFFAARVLDGVGLVPDEFTATNSVCYSNPFDDCPTRGAAATLSEFRIPADSGVQGRCSSVTSHVSSRVTTIRDADARKVRAAAAGIPQQLCDHSISCLRARQLQAESYCKVQAAQEPVYGTVASSTVQAVQSDQLSPEQLAELQALVEQCKDQISWTPDDIGKLTEKYKSYYMSIPM
jgi:hypothetical protein